MAAGAAYEMGHTNLMVFQGGMPEWTGKGYPVKSGNQPGKLK
jgi:3-mercaptopyruvate sulfurtransferase SseA